MIGRIKMLVTLLLKTMRLHQTNSSFLFSVLSFVLGFLVFVFALWFIYGSFSFYEEKKIKLN